MSATIITSFSGSFDYEPEIKSDTARDGITAFQFSIIGSLQTLNLAFLPDEDISGVPDQPPGSFRVVRRELSHIAGDPQTGLYRLSVSGEGGTGDSSLYISESSYAMQNQQVQGTLTQGTNQSQIQYNLIWLYPSATITTNSRDESPKVAEDLANRIVSNMTVSILKDRPVSELGTIGGPKLEGNRQLENYYLTGSSVEKAGGLYRIRATSSKGLIVF